MSHKRPPAVVGAQHPDDIIPADIADTFRRYYALACKLPSGEYEATVSKKFDQATRTRIGALLETITISGWRILGISAKGDIRWGQALDSRPDPAGWRQDEMYHSKEEIEEIKKKGRANYRAAIEKMKQVNNNTKEFLAGDVPW